MSFRSSFKNYWEVYFIAALVALSALEHWKMVSGDIWVNIAISQIMTVLILCARLLCKGFPQFSDATWLFVGAGIIAATIHFFVLIPESDKPSVQTTLQFLTLVWGPIGAGLVVGPIMKTNLTAPSVSPTVPAQVSDLPKLRLSIEIDGQVYKLARNEADIDTGSAATPSTPPTPDSSASS